MREGGGRKKISYHPVIWNGVIADFYFYTLFMN